MASTKAAPDVTANAGIEGAFQLVELSRLIESKTNPRRHFAGLDELTASVKQHGVLTPLLVRPVPGLDYEIIAGARRYRAAKAAKLPAVPVRVMELTDQQALEFQVIENLQRAEVHPLDEAIGYQQLIESVKTDAETGKPYDVALIAKKINKSERYVYQRIQLAKLTPEAQKAFLEDKMSASHAALICRLQPAEQKSALAGATKYDMSVRCLAEHIRDEFHLELKRAPFDTHDAELLPKAGSCAECPKRTGGNVQLFADVKEKDLCTDPACFKAKVAALVDRNSEQGLVSISSSYSAGYGNKPVAGVIYADQWTEAGKQLCPATRDAVVVMADEYEHPKIRTQLKVCLKKGECKVHGYNEPRTSTQRSAAAKAQDRKRDAISNARAEAVRQIGDKAKWPLNSRQFHEFLMAWYGRLTYDAGKLICKVLWPNEKGDAADARDRVKRWLRSAEGDTAAIAKAATILALVPEWGRWEHTYGGKEASQRLLAFGKAAGVDVAKIERNYLAELKDKRPKKAAKAKASAKPDKPKAKKAAKAKTAKRG